MIYYDNIINFVMLEIVFHGEDVTVNVESQGEGYPGHRYSVL
jgi:hypothetical protein